MPDYRQRYKRLETNVLHAGKSDPHFDGAVITPIFQSANYLMRHEESYDAVRYIRLNNSPNHHTLHARLAAIEGGEDALVTASGMAAISTTILAFCKKGDHVLSQKTLYGGTQTFLDHDAPKWGIEHYKIDIRTDASEWEKALRDNTKLIYVESISNPLVEVGDLKGVVAFAKKHNLVSVIDTTFATPVNFRPLEIGFDVALHSATKYLNGHSDIVAGCAIGSESIMAPIKHLALHLGGCLDPHACFLFERGLKTLALRVRQQNANALRLAEYLAKKFGPDRVNYPGLPTDKHHKWARDLFEGYGGMLSFYAGDFETADRFTRSTQIITHAASLGGVETLCVRPAASSHIGMTPELRKKTGITEDLVRISTGIEDVEELIEDFERAFRGVKTTVA